MNLLLRSCIVRQLPTKLFIPKITLGRRIFTYPINNNSKKFISILQARHSSTENNNVDKILIYQSNHKSVYLIKILHIILLLILPVALYNYYVKRNELSKEEKSQYMHEILIFSTPIIIIARYILKRFVVNMYYNPTEKKYSVTMMRPILKSNVITFTENDITQPTKKWQLATCFFKGKPVLFVFNNFIDRRHIPIMKNLQKMENFKVPKLQIPAINKMAIPKINNQVEKKDITKM